MKTVILGSPAFRKRTSNPYTWLLNTHISALRPDFHIYDFHPLHLLKHNCRIWHFHWPDSILNSKSAIKVILRILRLMSFLFLARIRGVARLWTVHNVKSHEKYHPGLEKLYWRIFLSQLDGYICLSKAARSIALVNYPVLSKKRGAVIFHADYRGYYKDRISRDEARKRLSIPADVLVMTYFGRIRRYKNTLNLIEAFNGYRNHNDGTVLLIVGKPDHTGTADKIRRSTLGDSKIITKLEFIADDKVQVLMNASDLLVFPYSSILNSGSIMLALSFAKPVLAPNLGSIPEIRDKVGDDWIYMYDGEIDSSVITKSVKWLEERNAGETPNLSAFEWPVVAGQTAEFYDSWC